MNIEKYEPSNWALSRNKSGHLWPCKGLAGIVTGARKLGWTVAVDLGGIEEELQEVTPQNAKMAVNEVDLADVYFLKDGERRLWMKVISSNDTDWLCDHTCSDWLEKLVEENTYE